MLRRCLSGSSGSPVPEITPVVRVWSRPKGFPAQDWNHQALNHSIKSHDSDKCNLMRKRHLLHRHVGQPEDLQMSPASQDAAFPAQRHSHLHRSNDTLKRHKPFFHRLTFLLKSSGIFSCKTATSLSPSNPTTSAAYSSPSVNVTCCENSKP